MRTQRATPQAGGKMTYRDVVAELRMKLAIEYLRNTQVTHSDMRRQQVSRYHSVTRGHVLND